MKFFSVLSAFALLASSAHAVERDLALGDGTQLEADWDIENPVLTHDPQSGKFTITTGHGSAFGIFHLGTYDICPNGDANFNGAQYQGSPFSYFSDNLDFIANNLYSWTATAPVGGSLGLGQFWNQEWEFDIDTSEIVNSPLYTENGEIGQAKFCMRYGNVDIQEGFFKLVNFRQMEITITWDLTAGFEVVTFYTQAVEEVTGSVATQIKVEGMPCATQLGGNTDNSPTNNNNNNNRDGTTGKPFNQGDEVCVTLCEEGRGGRITTINRLTATRVVPGNQYSQNVWINDAKVGNIVADPVDITAGTAPGTPTYGCVELRWILLGIMYPVDSNQTPTIATVEVDGDVSVTLLPVRRNLAEGRALQEEVQEVDFETSFKIMESPAEDSGASLMGMAGAAAMGAAALML